MDLEKAFDRLPRKMQDWALTKSGIPEVFVRPVMNLYKGV